MLWMPTFKVSDLPPAAGPLPEPTQQQISAFYDRLGMAVASWQFVESYLVWIYASAIGAHDVTALAASFHTPTSFRVRLDMTDTAIEHSGLEEPLKKEWKKLYDRALNRSKRRNKIAHAIVLFDPTKPNPDAQLFLASNTMNPAKAPSLAAQGEIISRSDLNAMIESFDGLFNDLHEFWTKLPPPERPGEPAQ